MASILVLDDEALVQRVLAQILEQNDEWAIQRRYMSLETLAGMRDDQSRLPAIAVA